MSVHSYAELPSDAICDGGDHGCRFFYYMLVLIMVNQTSITIFRCAVMHPVPAAE
jgi:hypothetical protein